MLAIVAPWLILITIKTQGAFFAESVGHDMMAKVAGGQESKGFPPGYYTLLFPVTFWPWSLLALPAIPWVWNNRRDPAVLFCLAWIIPAWLVFEAVPTKLFHYVLPVYAALALLTARAVLDGFGKARPWLTGYRHGPVRRDLPGAGRRYGGPADCRGKAVRSAVDPAGAGHAGGAGVRHRSVPPGMAAAFRHSFDGRGVRALSAGVPVGVPPVGNHLAQPSHRFGGRSLRGPVPTACSSPPGLPNPASSFWSAPTPF